MSESLRCSIAVDGAGGVGCGNAYYDLIFINPGVPHRDQRSLWTRLQSGSFLRQNARSLGGWLFEQFLVARATSGLKAPEQGPELIPPKVLRERTPEFAKHLVLSRSHVDPAVGCMQHGAHAVAFSLPDVEAMTLFVPTPGRPAEYAVGFQCRGHAVQLAPVPIAASDSVTLDLMRVVIQIVGFFEWRFDYVEGH